MDWAPEQQSLRRKTPGQGTAYRAEDFQRLKRRLLALSAMLLAATPGGVGEPAAQAGVGYYPVPLSEPAPTGLESLNGENFPESRWGSAPLRARAIGFEEEQNAAFGGGRSPAGARSRGGESSDMASLDREVPSASTQYRDALPGDPLQPNPAKNGVQEIAIIAGDLGFFPKKIFVNRDMPVRLFVTGASRKNLCVLIDAFQVRRQVKSQKVEEVSFTPGTPGTFRMHCPINGIEGTLVVRELPAATQLAGGPGLAAPRMGAGE